MERIGHEQSDRIWVLKAVAIFTVFFAHMPWAGNNSVMHKTYCLLGIIGVPSFLFLSGYLSAGSKSSLPNRIKKLCIPLFIWASLTFVVSCFISKEIGGGILLLINYIRWTLGSGSIYYFVPLLLVCMALSKYVNSYLLIILSIISITLSWDFIPHNRILTRYLNPFNFILYFELGKIAREQKWQINNKMISAIGSLSILIIVGVLWPSFEPCYFSILCIPFVIAAFMFIDTILRLFSLRFMIPIGKYSFVIYLCHILIAGVINGRLHGWMEYIKVPVAFIITCIFVFALKLSIDKVFSNEKVSVWLGYR